jgi:hypothetical protein
MQSRRTSPVGKLKLTVNEEKIEMQDTRRSPAPLRSTPVTTVNNGGLEVVFLVGTDSGARAPRALAMQIQQILHPHDVTKGACHA